MEVLRPIGAVILERMSTSFFSLDQLMEISGHGRIPVRRALERLCREGIIKKIEKFQQGTFRDGEFLRGRPALQITYRLADKKKLAARIASKLKEGTAADRMWKVIRYQGRFNRHELVSLAEVTFENAKWYTKQLRKAGIIIPSKKGGPGVEWVLIKDTGAKRPL